jgi:hypothetical protein
VVKPQSWKSVWKIGKFKANFFGKIYEKIGKILGKFDKNLKK